MKNDNRKTNQTDIKQNSGINITEERLKIIRHDVNNAISNLQGAIFLLKDEVRNKEDAKHLFDIIERNCESIKNLLT